MTLTDAISSAGGLTEFARRSRIRVFRKDHSIAGDYNYDDILKHKIEDPILMPGDRVFVDGAFG
jgi:protein involved in polysaccharide export with SLBB domain